VSKPSREFIQHATLLRYHVAGTVAAICGEGSDSKVAEIVNEITSSENDTRDLPTFASPLTWAGLRQLTLETLKILVKHLEAP
jgi:hypothetical protein